MLVQLPAGYHETHRHFSRDGCRVLALGYKKLAGDGGPENQLALKNLATANGGREEFESGLTFAGFLVLSCPLKPDAAHSIAHLAQSSHQLMMITGDHVLTACSVATELTIATRPILILSLKEAGAGATASAAGVSKDSGVQWVSVDETVVRPFDMSCSKSAIEALNAEFDLCMSGDAMEHLLLHGLAPKLLGRIVQYVCVFARTSPDMKVGFSLSSSFESWCLLWLGLQEFVLTWLKRAGLTTLMCGDGTNDVGALKQAHVGVALIGHEAPEMANIYAKSVLTDTASDCINQPSSLECVMSAVFVRSLNGQPIAKVEKEAEPEETDASAGSEGSALALRRTKARKDFGPVPPAGARKPPPKKLTVAAAPTATAARRPPTLREQINAAVRKMEQETKDEDRIVRLGDASIASPFTSKIPYIASSMFDPQTPQIPLC